MLLSVCYVELQRMLQVVALCFGSGEKECCGGAGVSYGTDGR